MDELNNFIRRVDRIIKKHKYRLIFDFLDDWSKLKLKVRDSHKKHKTEK